MSLNSAFASADPAATNPLSNAPFWFWWVVPVVIFLVVAAVRTMRREYRPRGGFKSVADFDRFRSTMTQVRHDREVEKQEH
jgi:hypothetical protein